MKLHKCVSPLVCTGCHMCGARIQPLFECDKCTKIVCMEEAFIFHENEYQPLASRYDFQIGKEYPHELVCQECVPGLPQIPAILIIVG